MFKTIYRLKPGDSWRIGEHESWFSYMAAKGYQVQSVGARFAKFRKAEPKKIKYRMEIAPKATKEEKLLRENPNEIDETQKSIYEQCGWTHVYSWKYPNGNCFFHLFSSPEELNAPELHTDPVEQSYTLTVLDKSMWKNLIITSIGWIGFLILIYISLRNNQTPYLTLTTTPSLINLVLFVLYFYLFFDSLMGTLSIRSLKRNLTEGKPLNHAAPWKKTLFFTRLMVVIYIAMVSPMIFSNFKEYSSRPLPLIADDTPIILLNEFEDAEKSVPISTPYNTIATSNYFLKDANFFSPINYKTEENIKIPDKVIDDRNTPYTASLFTNITKTRFEFMADNLYAELLETYEKYSGADFQEDEHPNFHQLYISESAKGYDILAYRGHGIIYFSYIGDADINSALEVISEKLTLIE